MNNKLSEKLGFGIEQSLAATLFDSTMQAIGDPLPNASITLIIDNQTDVSVPISVDGTNIWKTFAAGEALVLDIATNKGNAATRNAEKHIQFFTNAAVGTSGSIRISYNYAR